MGIRKEKSTLVIDGQGNAYKTKYTDCRDNLSMGKGQKRRVTKASVQFMFSSSRTRSTLLNPSIGCKEVARRMCILCYNSMTRIHVHLELSPLVGPITINCLALQENSVGQIA